VRCLGPANPSYYERLRRYAKLARKRGREQQEKAEMEVRMMPVRYAFAQEVTLYRKERATGQHGRQDAALALGLRGLGREGMEPRARCVLVELRLPPFGVCEPQECPDAPIGEDVRLVGIAGLLPPAGQHPVAALR
jgi:hypothetical protein